MSIEVRREGRVLHVALNRPEKRNALNGALCEALVQTIEEGNADTSVGAILLSGNGPVFCAGMDLSETEDFAPLHEKLFTSIERAGKPLIAAVQGAALAGGMGLAANAHIVIAHPAARFGLTEIRIGLWPVLVFRAVVLAIGERRATELSITGRLFEAGEAKEYGLVTELSEDPLKSALETAAAVSGFSANAMAAGLRYSRAIRNMDWKEAGRAGQSTRAALMNHPDFKTATAKFRK
ncbi:MAG: enoyl-CoA hydratase/isomerase family protein [Acidobacteriota bacterium]|nr:enoyl-CoA hydratase/isomerase family protein [Acidobacteriota bacterium]